MFEFHIHVRVHIHASDWTYLYLGSHVWAITNLVAGRATTNISVNIVVSLVRPNQKKNNIWQHVFVLQNVSNYVVSGFIKVVNYLHVPLSILVGKGYYVEKQGIIKTLTISR